MKNIGILTLNGNFNYGNRLQNYALQEVLIEQGFYVETIINATTKSPNLNKVNKFIPDKLDKFLSGSTYDVMNRVSLQIWKKSNKKVVRASEVMRKQNFESFTSKNIKETSFQISDENIPIDLSSKYDYFVTGSDQVWNPFFRHGSSIDFIAFAPIKKRIAYAPSFGVEEIPEEYKAKYKVWLSEMEKISVREGAGAKIIKELTEKTVPVVLDPTLLLTKEKWLSVAKKSYNKTKNRYLLTYFLGGIPREHKKQINNIARVNNLEIVNLGDVKDLTAYQAGPSEFIDYIMSASVFCTDSFHGVIFSILFSTPFIVFKRKTNLPSMYSRIDTLLETFKLESRESNSIQTTEDVVEVDFSNIDSILKRERQKSLDFLRASLDLI